MNTEDLQYQQKSKSMSSEQNYFSLFAMRYPVVNKSVSVWGLFKIKASALLLAPARVKAEHTTCPTKLV